MRGRRRIWVNFLKMRMFLSKLANNSPISTRIFSFWGGLDEFSVFFSWFSHNFCQCTDNECPIKDILLAWAAIINHCLLLFAFSGLGKIMGKLIFPFFFSKWANYSPILRKKMGKIWGKYKNFPKFSHNFPQCGPRPNINIGYLSLALLTYDNIRYNLCFQILYV